MNEAGKVYVTKEFAFDAAHKLYDYNGKCANLHGHTYRLQVTVCGVPDAETGLLMDFSLIKMLVTDFVLCEVDHRNLTDVFLWPTTAENLCMWVWRTIEPLLPKGAALHEVRLWETPTCCASYRGGADKMLFYQEVFLSVNGESSSAGLPTIFVRLWGCPLRCAYCDQPQPKSSKKRVSVERLVDLVRAMKCPRVCVTGGEPLAQEETYSFIYELLTLDFEVSVETSGCVPIEPVGYRRSFRYVMDLKCPSSGVSDRNVLGNLALLQAGDEVKVVVQDRGDYDYFARVIKSHPTRAAVIVAPVVKRSVRYGHRPAVGSELVDWLLADRRWNVRVGYQLHKAMGVR